MSIDSGKWHLPPWTDEDVANINDFQRSGAMHPFTCGCGPVDGDDFDWPDRVLVAHADGLRCPNGRCPVQTTHVDRTIADGSLLRSIRQDWSTISPVIDGAPHRNDWEF